MVMTKVFCLAAFPINKTLSGDHFNLQANPNVVTNSLIWEQFAVKLTDRPFNTPSDCVWQLIMSSKSA